jgi:hypothetical protein
MLGNVVFITAQSYLYGFEGVVTAEENGLLTLRILVDEPSTGNLVAGEIEVQIDAAKTRLASAATVARYQAGKPK